MKKYIFLLAFTFTVSFVSAQIDSVMYGVNADLTYSAISLAKIDPVTGIVTNISANSYPYSLSNVGETIDPFHKIYYQPTDSVLVAFDLVSGNLLFARPISYLVNSMFLGINFNCPDSTIYGISFDTTNGDCRLSWLDPNTGFVHGISSSPLPHQFGSLYGNAIDPFSGIYYYVSPSHRIVGVSLATGNVVSDTTIIISYGTFGPIVFDCLDSTIYGLAGNMTSGRKFAKINPVTGLVTNISPSNNVMAIYSDPATIDPFKRVYYFKNVDSTLYGVNIETGEMYSDPAIQYLPGTRFFNFFYNHPCFVSYPVGTTDSQPRQQDAVLYPNPAEDFLHLKFGQPTSGKLNVFSVLGDRVFSWVFVNENDIRINLAKLTGGVYFIRITQKEFTQTLSFIKR